MADDTDTPEESRLDRIEATQQQQGGQLERIEQALARIIPGSHADAEQRTEQRLDRPSTIEEQVRAELARAKSEQDRETERSEHETLKETVARLTERPPKPPERRSTVLMWGKTG